MTSSNGERTCTLCILGTPIQTHAMLISHQNGICIELFVEYDSEKRQGFKNIESANPDHWYGGQLQLPLPLGV